MSSRMKKSNSTRSKDSTHYENLFEYNVNFKERVIYLNSEIDEGSLEVIQKAFDEFEVMPDKPVRIEISSYGGSVYDMFGIIDRIKASPCRVITRGLGKIMSAATFILAAGDERSVGPNSWVMVHQANDTIRGKTDSLNHDMAHHNQVQDQMYTLYESLSGNKKVSAKQWKKLCAKDHYIRAEDVLELGLVDHVTDED
jgi:ATP-dependent Clp protease protease subunit